MAPFAPLAYCGGMQASDFRAALLALQMTPKQAAAYLCVTDSAVRRWAHGKRAIPGPICKLIEMALSDLGATR